MGTTRTLVAWLAALGIWVLPYSAHAQDFGPGTEVRAIRRDLPIVLAARLLDEQLDPKALKIDTVLVDDDHALTQWHDGATQRIDILAKIYGVWWLRQQMSIGTDGATWCCENGSHVKHDPRGPSTDFLRELPDMTPTLADKAADHLPLVREADKRDSPSTHSFSEGGDGPVASRVPFASNGPTWTGVTDAYVMTISFASNDAPSGADLTNLVGRPPTLGESWITEHSDSYYFFSATVTSDETTPIHVSSGTQIRVWFPFALNPSKRYSLTIGNTQPPLGPIVGALRDNTLSFMLPSFAMTPQTELMGEIAGN